jgi:hypothetical protein
MDSLGKGTKEFYLEGAVNRDWEDMAISKFSDGTIYMWEILAIIWQCIQVVQFIE